MNVHDEYRCTARYPYPCTNPVAYLVTFEDDPTLPDYWAPADRYTCADHLEDARKGDRAVSCSVGGCGRIYGQTYPANVIVAGKPYCQTHGRHEAMRVRHAELRTAHTV